MATPILSILNMKGGVGKTTVSAHVMRVLYNHMSKRVLLIDLDAQFNLTQSIMTQENYDKLDERNTVQSCFEPLPSNDFFQVKHSDQPPPKATDICHPLRYYRKPKYARLDLIPGSFELMKYSMIDDPAQLRHASGYLKRFISQARKEYDLIVLDCNPSSSFVTKCALENSTHVLSPVKLDKFSILGVGMVGQLFEHLKLDPVHIILINGVTRYGGISEIEMELRAHPTFGAKVLINSLVQSKHLSADPSYTGFATDKGGPYSIVLRNEIREIAQEISNHLGIN